jgi:hypothetical protein
MKSGQSAPNSSWRVRPRLEVLEKRELLATFEVKTVNDFVQGSLRAAIDAANANPGVDLISFSIGGGGTHTIKPLAPLPPIYEAVVIDGYTQPGAKPNTLAVGSDAKILIELDGSAAGTGTHGLTIVGGNVTVRGLIVNRFDSDGIRLQGPGGNTIAGNFIGTDTRGSVAKGNGGGIVIVDSSTNVIGGTNPGDRNVVSGNEFANVFLIGALSQFNVMLGNYVGTDAQGTAGVGGLFGFYIDAPFNAIGGSLPGSGNVISGNTWGMWSREAGHHTVIQGNHIGVGAAGTDAVPNTSDGILNCSFCTIGGAQLGAGNVIAGNGQFGIWVNGMNQANLIQGNYIGTDETGTLALPNGQGGILISEDSSANLIGGTVPGSGNVIANNANFGVFVIGNATLGNAIRGSSFYNNSGPGIELVNGGNAEQPAPIVIVRKLLDGFTVSVGIEGPVSTRYAFDVYVSAACDPSGFGEGQQYVGSLSGATDLSGKGGGVGRFKGTFPPGYVVTATATSPEGNTSEFSNCAPNGAGLIPYGKLEDLGAMSVRLDEDVSSQSHCLIATSNTKSEYRGLVNELSFAANDGGTSVVKAMIPNRNASALRRPAVESFYFLDELGGSDLALR